MSWQDRHYNRESQGFGFQRQPQPRGTVVMWLIGINCVIFVLDGLTQGSKRASWLSLSDAGAFSIERALYGLQLWRWVTYQFLHGDFLHLLFNMIGLFFFGRLMESWWGARRFIAFYLFCGTSGAFLFTLLSFVPGLLDVGPGTTLVGASGSVFGILVGCALLYPHQRVMLMFPPIPMSMRTMALVFLGIAALSVTFGSMNAGGDAAHLGGAALGYILVIRPQLLAFAEGGGGMRERLHHRHAERNRQRRQGENAEVDRILDKVR